MPNSGLSASADSTVPQATPATARIVPAAALAVCAERLRAGRLVAFPTETVYGLGCHALDAVAVDRVFRAKERPRTDPLIVHVHEPAQAFALWRLSAPDRALLAALCDAFWPGPLTLVAPADAAAGVPDDVTAGTGCVACRSPAHRLARRLLRAARVPVAAPSANKFGHVSPTAARHVLDDLHGEDVWILEDEVDDSGDGNGEEDGGDARLEDDDDGAASSFSAGCHVGVESTVVQLQPDGNLLVLRQGAISARDLEECLRRQHPDVRVTARTHEATADTVATVAPGQSIRHYSPRLPSYLLSDAACNRDPLQDQRTADRLRSVVVVDFGARLAPWRPHCRAYRDLSARGSSAEAARALFDTLRWAEQVGGAELVLFPTIQAASPTVAPLPVPSASTSSSEPPDALLLALKDRLTRAASGVVIDSLEGLVIQDGA